MGVVLALWESILNKQRLILPGKQTVPLFEQPLGYFVQLDLYCLRGCGELPVKQGEDVQRAKIP